LLANPGGQTPTETPPTNTSGSPTPATTPTSNTIPLDESQIIGRTQPVVEEYLTGLELSLNAQVGQPAPTPEEVGLAYSVSPRGNVRKGEVITVNFYDSIPEVQPPPAPEAVTAPAGPHLAGAVVTISWPTYNGCPVGQSLTGYNFTIGGATPVEASNPVDPGMTEMDIELVAGDNTISYVALCTEMESAPSGTTTITAV
jgi:serine/threonine-protein kinase